MFVYGNAFVHGNVHTFHAAIVAVDVNPCCLRARCASALNICCVCLLVKHVSYVCVCACDGETPFDRMEFGGGGIECGLRMCQTERVVTCARVLY